MLHGSYDETRLRVLDGVVRRLGERCRAIREGSLESRAAGTTNSSQGPDISGEPEAVLVVISTPGQIDNRTDRENLAMDGKTLAGPL
jgi:hypothetical protein